MYILLLNIVTIILMTVCTTVLIQYSVQNKAKNYFIACQILTINWTICHMFDVLATDRLFKMIFSSIGYVSVCSIGTVFLLFSLLYIKSSVFESKIFRIVMFIPSAVLIFLEMTDPIFHLFFTSFFEETKGGFGFYITVGYTYLLLIVGIVLILLKNIVNFRDKLPQLVLIVMSAVIPLIVNILSVTDVLNIKYDFTPFSFSISSIMVFLAIYKFDFMSISPFAAKHLLNSIDEAVLISDNKKSVVYFNEKMRNTFLLNEDCIYKSLDDVMSIVSKSIYTEMVDFQYFYKNKIGKFTLQISDNRFYSINKIEVVKNKKAVSNVFIFTDVSAYYDFANKLSLKNNELDKLNKEIQKLNQMEKDFAVEKERTRIAQELHDSLGHGLVSIMTLLKISEIKKDQAEKNIAYALEISEKLLENVRECVSGIKENSSLTLVDRLNVLIEEMKTDKIKLTVMGKESAEHLLYADMVFSIAREAITNSLRHGKADNIEIIIKFCDDCIKEYIIDDGVGCEEINMGYGLNGMKAKAESIGGTVEFSSVNESGFSVVAVMPMRLNND